MRICIFGAGGVGGYFGARLIQAGEDVTFVARGAHLAALRSSGLRVFSVSGDVRIERVFATDDPAAIGTVDVVILGVKSWQVTDAASAMGPLMGGDTVVVPLQNGVEAPERLEAVLGPAHAAGGLCRLIATLEAPGVIRHPAAKPLIVFGELDNRASGRLDALQSAFSRAPGVTASVSRDIQGAMWEKWLMMAPWGGLGALTRSPLGAVLALTETRRLLRDLMTEVARLAAARGVRLPEDVVDRTLGLLEKAPGWATTSMQRDIMAGRSSELEDQCGAVGRLGAAGGVDTPLNDLVYHCLLPQEHCARGRPLPGCGEGPSLPG